MSQVGLRSDAAREKIKNEIKSLFDSNVRGKDPTEELKSLALRHHGSSGHWLEEQFGLHANAANAPDFKGFELKDATHSKTTFGDWSADAYIFYSHAKCQESIDKKLHCKKCNWATMPRSEFLHTFGAANPEKGGRYSWSGAVFPKIGKFNMAGQTMNIEKDLSISISYSFDKDFRTDRFEVVSDHLRQKKVILAFWSASTLQEKLENKFSEHGWFKCIREHHNAGKYIGVKFGRPIDFKEWIRCVADGRVYLDSGMYEGNDRKYSQWRANNSFWDSLVDEEYL